MLVLSLAGAVAGIVELHVVYTVYALIGMSLAGMYLLNQRANRR